MTKWVFMLIAVAALVGGAGCKPRATQITPSQRREAAGLASEAQFALSVRDVARAETALAQAAALCPDWGDYWLELGRCRVKLGNRSAARDAYKAALGAYETDAKRDPAIRGGAILRQIYVLALLGRVDDARAVLAKALQYESGNPLIREFAEKKRFEEMLASAAYKEGAL
jgi:tetratricopeptide (TPR) repeat protein